MTRPAISDQELFNRMCKHMLVDQKYPARDTETGRCRYLLDNIHGVNQKCVVGALLVPPANHKERVSRLRLEGGADSPDVIACLDFDPTPLQISIMNRMQQVHDVVPKSVPMRNSVAAIAQVAHLYDLYFNLSDYPEVPDEQPQTTR